MYFILILFFNLTFFFLSRSEVSLWLKISYPGQERQQHYYRVADTKQAIKAEKRKIMK